ncbi:MAG TPA: type II secretion system F family protein [Clostridiaceae bacterium]|jgi:tight adherence protein C|nr:type II secretion system F family protein [Clostridiaceae bacterium]
MIIISGVVLVITILIYCVFQGLSYKKYIDFFAPLDDKSYSYKKFLPGCLGIVEMFQLSGAGRYQTKLNQKLVMLYGSRNLSYYAKVHWSVKIFYLFLGVILGALFCILDASNYSMLLAIPFSGMALFFLVDNNLDNQYKKRRFQLERDFPNFISKLILLVNAGLNVRQAIERIVADSNKEEPLYKELQCVISDIKAGVLEYEAYMDFSERCKIKQITNFVSIIQQNMKLGGSQMLFELKRMGTECWEMRKNVAKQLGEKASSKLMLPLSIMFLAIVLICVAPVILELRSTF